jgi:hypothetical protein
MKIRFANDYTTDGGRTYKAGTVAEIADTTLARNLIHRGKATDETPVRQTVAKPSAAAETTTETPAAGDKGKE